MKFRGKMVDVAAVKQFSNLLITLSKLCKNCVLRLCTDKLYFIISDETGLPSNFLSWCSIDQAHFFNEYTMEGVNQETHNEIMLLLSPDMLSNTLNSKQISLAKSIKIKLTNKTHPCLTVQIDLPSQTLLSRTCVHDVPVNLLPRSEWNMYQDLKIPTPDISIVLRKTKILKNVIERMKKLSLKLEIRACNTGEFRLSIETELASVATYFLDLDIRSENAATNTNDPIVVSLWIDIRKLLQFLASDHINPDQAICNLLEDRLLYMHYSHEALDFHYFIPGISL